MNTRSKLAAAPYLLWMVVFIVVPLILIAVFAFTTTATCDAEGNILSEEALADYLAECEENETEPELTEKTIFTLQNILDVSKYTTVLINSAWLALIATVICLVIAYPLAYMISRMLGGGTNMLIGDLIDLQFLGNAYNPNLGAAISLVLMVFIFLCMSITNQLDNEEMDGVLL